jgi:hypothetical protein
MLIVLLAVLGVDLVVIVAAVVTLLLRRRWLARHGAVPCRIRVVEGEVEGLATKWRTGRMRWVRDVLVFSPAPFMAASRVIPIDQVKGDPRPAAPGEGKRLGSEPVVISVAAGGFLLELAVRRDDRDAALAPFATPAAMGLDAP